MKKYIKFSRMLAVVISICMIVSAMPIFVSAAATMQYLNLYETDQNEYGIEAVFANAPDDNAVESVAYITGSSNDIYVVNEDLSETFLIINDVTVTLGANGSIDGNNILTAGDGCAVMGTTTFATEDIEACTYTDPLEIALYFLSISDTVNVCTVAGNTTIDENFRCQKLIVSSGTLTITGIVWINNVVVKNGASIYIQAPVSGDPNGLNIYYGGTLTVEQGGSIYGDEGQILELGTDATAMGLDFYINNSGSISSFTPEITHNPYDFEYHNNCWVLPGQGSSYYRIFARDVYDPQYGGGYIHVSKSSDLGAGEMSINPGFTEEYQPGETLFFHVLPPADEENVSVKYTVVDPSDGSMQTYSASYDSYANDYYFSILTDDSYDAHINDLVIIITWSQAGYDFDVTYFNSGICTQADIYGRVENDTHVTTVNPTREMTYRGTLKAQFAQNTSQIEYHLYPGQRREINRLYIDGDEYTKSDILSGALPTGCSYIKGSTYDTFILPTPDADREYYVSFEVEEIPGYSVYFDDMDFTVSASTGSTPQQISKETVYDYPASGTLTLTVTKTNPNALFRGIIVYNNDPQIADEYIKAEDLQNGNQLVITDFSRVRSINVVSWECPFDNELQIQYDDNIGDVEFAGSHVDNYELISITKNTPYTIELTPPAGIISPYKVELEYNGGNNTQDITNEFVNNAYTFTATSDAGVVVRVYWTQEEYEFNNMVAHEGEQIVTVNSYGDGAAQASADFQAGSAEYNGAQRIIVGITATYIEIQITPAYGAELRRVTVDGVEYTNQVSNGRLILQRPANTVIYIDVEFTRVDDLFDVDGNGVLDAYDYSALRNYAEASSNGSNLNMNICDLNGDGGIDGLDVIFLDLYRNRIIEFDGTPKQQP